MDEITQKISTARGEKSKNSPRNGKMKWQVRETALKNKKLKYNLEKVDTVV